MENDLQMTALMEQLEKNSRKQLRYARIQCLFAVVAALCCLAVLILVVRLLPQIQEFTAQMQSLAGQVQELGNQAETVLANLETVTSDLAEADLAGMVTNVDTLVTSSQSALEQAIAKIETMDIETLNKAIKNLSSVIEPLAKFFNILR